MGLERERQTMGYGCGALVCSLPFVGTVWDVPQCLDVHNILTYVIRCLVVYKLIKDWSEEERARSAQPVCPTQIGLGPPCPSTTMNISSLLCTDDPPNHLPTPSPP